MLLFKYNINNVKKILNEYKIKNISRFEYKINLRNKFRIEYNNKIVRNFFKRKRYKIRRIRKLGYKYLSYSKTIEFLKIVKKYNVKYINRGIR